MSVRFLSHTANILAMVHKSAALRKFHAMMSASGTVIVCTGRTLVEHMP